MFAQKAEIKLKWASNQKSFLESSATVADINNNGLDEAIIASQEELIAVGKDGKTLWRWKTKGRFMTYPAILKRSGQPALIYAADNQGLLTCISGNGKVVWQAKLNAGSEWSAAVIADLDGNGVFEVIQTDTKGTVWEFDALNGKVLKKITIAGQPVSPAVGDLDGDGKSEIAIATNDGSVTVLDHNLSVLWRYKIGGFSESWSTSAPVMFAASDGKKYIVAASSTGEIFCFDVKGNPFWQYPTNVPVSSSISVGDFDQNGQADIFLITQSGLIYRFDEKGNVIWKIDMQGRSLASGAIADINGDGKPEYILSTQQGHFLILNQQGNVIFDRQLPSRTINVTPSIGNITGNSQKTDLFLTGGEAGSVYCFESQASKNPVMQWTSYRCNIQNTGSWFGLEKSDELRMIPQNLGGNKLMVGERVQFNIVNPVPGPNPLKASAVCINPDGSKYSAIANIQGKSGQLLLPVDCTLPGNYKFSWALTTSEGKEVLASSREINIQAFQNDQALSSHAVSLLNSSADEVSSVLPLSANALRKEAFEIQFEANAVLAQQKMVPVNDALTVQTTINTTSKLDEEAKRAVRISEVVHKAARLGSGTSLIAFEGIKWENRNVDKQLPAKVENPVLLNHTAITGEHEPVPVVLFNVTDHLLNVRVLVNNPDKQIKVRTLHSINVPTSMGEESWDALPELDESGIISIPSLSSREVWLDIETGDAGPGKHEIEVTLQSLNGAGVLDAPTNPHEVLAPETKVKISLDILPFKMAPSGTMRLCTWSPSEGPDIEDLLAHGNNVFLLAQPILNYNSQNEITSINYSKFDKITGQFKGKDIFFLISGLPGIKAEFGSETYQKQLSYYLKDLVSHLALTGTDLSHFALYPFDEPGGNGWNVVNQLVKFSGMVNAVNPDILTYVDGGGELPMFQEMSKYLDIWSPSFDWLGDKNPVMDVMRNTGKALWSYNCSYGSSRPVGPNTKNINLFYEYRTAALFAIRNGATGIGFWCYNAETENMWSRAKMEYNLVYPGTTKPVTSRRWEAVREGIEDSRILTALKEYLKSEAKTDKKVQGKIEHLIQVSLPELVDPASDAVKFGQSREVFDMLGNDTKMNEFRNEMMYCIQAVIASEPGRKGKILEEKTGISKGK
ncbi:MAG: PQQ-binding-like beta-propeller repeat protein [Bacteroidota bacterium]|nr:PQQ-binding-like beta-propeller repeat protein [Bacteroidota bacterium]